MGIFTLVKLRPFRKALSAMERTPLGMSAVPAHEVLLVTTLAVTVKVPVVQL